MPKTSKKKNRGEKFYAVKVGRTPGVYSKWDEAEAQVSLDPFPVLDCMSLIF